MEIQLKEGVVPRPGFEQSCKYLYDSESGNPTGDWMRRFWNSIILMVLVFSIALPHAIIEADALQETTIDITIAYTHDVHGHLYSDWTGTQCSGGMSLLSTKIQELRALRPLLLFDCGDIMSGSPVNDFNNGLPIIEVMNAIGYDAMALDNHEFDPGTNALKSMIDAADFEVLSANVDWPGSPKPLPYSIETVAGYDIGVIGLSTSFWYAPEEVTFADQATAAQAAVTELQGLGIDFIILLGCLSSSLASSVSGIDVLVKASGPEIIGNTLVVPSVGSYASAVGVLDITIDTSDGTIDGYSFSSHTLGSSLDPDENIVSIIDSWNAPLAEHLDTAMGYFDTFQDGNALGNHLANAILQQTSADVAVYNFGGIRDTIDSGFITYRDLYRTEPFFNFVATVDLKGSDVVSVIGSNFDATDITSFEPDTWYTVASSNFSITSFERSYTSDAINRQDYPSVSVVDTLAEYLSGEYPITSPDLLEAIDDCRSSVSALPDSYLTGETPADLRSQINDDLLDARNALVVDNNTLAGTILLTSIDSIDTHVNVSCPNRWLTTNLVNILEYIGYPTTPLTTTSSMQTSTTITTTTTTDTPYIPPLSINDILYVVVGSLLGVLVVVVGYYYIPFEKFAKAE